MDQAIRFCNAPDGVRIAYATSGKGPLLVKAANWLNHLEFDWESPIWRHVFRELSQDHRLVRYDERGNGLSDWDVKTISFDAFVLDLETVVDAASLERFALLGISQGGAVAIEYAVRHPERVSQLILYGAFIRGADVRASTERERETRQALRTLMKNGWGQDNPVFRQVWTAQFVPGGTPEQTGWFNELQRITTSPDNAVRLAGAMGAIDVSDRVSRVSIPTLVLHVCDDPRVPFAEGRDLAASIREARFVPLEGQNHLLLEDEPAWPRFLAEVRAFLGTTESSRAGTVTTPRPRLARGLRLGHYEVSSLLGTGGMGQVYRARDTKLDRDVAIKLLTDQSGDQTARARLLREARHAAALNHPNICTIHEVSEAAGYDFIVMEYVEGQPLGELIPKGGLGTAAILQHATQIARALDHAHSRGVVHRDLKSANVVVTADDRVKVLDFGVARRVTAPDLETLTRTQLSIDEAGRVTGTLPYMAPEVLRGEPADTRSDLWSLGVLLYEMATSRLPFSGGTGFELTSAILRDPPNFPRSRGSSGLRNVIQRCLVKDPGNRYQRASEVGAALEALSADPRKLSRRKS